MQYARLPYEGSYDQMKATKFLIIKKVVMCVCVYFYIFSILIWEFVIKFTDD